MKAKLSNNLIPILETPSADEQRQSLHFHASSLRDCGRRMVLQLMGYKEARVSKPRWTRAAEMGDHFHDYLTDLAKRQGILEAAELPLDVDPEYFVSGRVDAIVNRNGNRRVVEIKSMDDSKFKLFFPGDEKFEAAYAQISYYIWALHLEGGFILAINRDSCDLKEFTVTPDEPYIMALLTRIKRLKGHLDAKTLPEPERTKNCRFCGFKGTDQCHDDARPDWI